MISWIIIGVLGALVLGPILSIVVRFESQVVLENFQSSGFVRSLWLTLISGIGGSALSLIGALGLAHRFALSTWKWKRAQKLLLLLPYLVPNFILAAAYVVAWNPGTGLLESWIPFPFGLYGVWGMTFVFGVAHLPVAFLLLEDRLRRIDFSLREAAQLSGARALYIFFKIDFPLIRSTFLGAFALCFALNISAFAIPAWIGAPANTYLLTFKVYQALQMGGPESISLASSYAFVLFLMAVIPIGLIQFFSLKNRSYDLVTGKATRQAQLESSPGILFQLSYWTIQVVIWILPLGCLFLTTLVKPGCLQREGLSCFSEISFRSYIYVLTELKETQDAFKNSFVYGSLSALSIILISIFSLWAFHRNRFQTRIWEGICSLPVISPGAVIALGLIVTYSGQYGVNLYNTAWIVVAALIIKHLNLGYQPIWNGFSTLSKSLIDAARICGASSRTTWMKIILPILRTEVTGAFFLALIPILGELTMSVLLASPSFRSIGTLLFDLQDYADQASAGALSVILVLVILTLNEMARKVSGGKMGF